MCLGVCIGFRCLCIKVISLVLLVCLLGCSCMVVCMVLFYLLLGMLNMVYLCIVGC